MPSTKCNHRLIRPLNAMTEQTAHIATLKVVHLNASSAGGAFVAAQRLSQALSQTDHIESSHWVFEGGRVIFICGLINGSRKSGLLDFTP